MIVVLTAALPAGAQSIGSPASGRDLARQWCSSCHAIDAGVAESPRHAAPAFAALAGQPRITETSLRVFLQTPHIDMPNLVLKPEQIDDLVAHILSLRR
jgi:mono/diheme cytochrome c family protein